MSQQLGLLMLLSLGCMSDVEGSPAPKSCTGLSGASGEPLGDHKPAWLSPRSQCLQSGHLIEMGLIEFPFIIWVLWVHALASVFVVVHKKAKRRQAVVLYCYKGVSASGRDSDTCHLQKLAFNTLSLLKQANSHSNSSTIYGRQDSIINPEHFRLVEHDFLCSCLATVLQSGLFCLIFSYAGV